MPLFLDPADSESECKLSNESRQVADSIENYTLKPFNGGQKFLIQLLCESYDEKLNSTKFEMSELNSELVALKEENNLLRTQLMLLRESNKNLNAKLRESNNMVRILSNHLETDETQEDYHLSTATIDYLVDVKLGQIKEIPTIQLAEPREFTKKRKRSFVENSS